MGYVECSQLWIKSAQPALDKISRILYYVNIMQMGTINIGFAPMYIVKCKLSYIKKKQKIKPP